MTDKRIRPMMISPNSSEHATIINPNIVVTVCTTCKDTHIWRYCWDMDVNQLKCKKCEHKTLVAVR